SAQPPSATVDTTASESSGRTIAVPSGGDLQAALESAQAGDSLVLEPGATYRGPFTLPRKSGSGWIVIRTAYAGLPQTGVRVDPARAGRMAKLVAAAGSGPVVRTAPGAHHYRFVGLEIRPAGGAFLYGLVGIGLEETVVDGSPATRVYK